MDMRPFCEAYATAFSTLDIDAICALWAFPALITTPERTVAFDEPDFRNNIVALCAFYRAQGLALAKKTLLSQEKLFGGLVSIRTADEVRDASGAVIANWEHAYILRQTPNGWRAILAAADGELAAWAARGTPLGSSS